MDEQLQQLIDRVKQAQNVLVTVSKSPSLDQLSAALGLTLALNKVGKHGTAVFSGTVPSALKFLKPEQTLEKNTDSLRDFIIALDKNKADKLRYKVEDDVVRIFITPYKTSISQKDLDFSQGDFNVDVVIALGVTEQQDLDAAIIAHGRILHDATVASVSTQGQGSLGSINWVEPTASSLSEMMVGLSDALDRQAMDNQIATAFLTGIVATTERFRNDKTSPKTMSAAAELMAAGANQQLIATELEPEPEPPTKPKHTDSQPKEAEDESELAEEPEQKVEPGTLEIDHDAVQEAAAEQPDEPESETDEPADTTPADTSDLPAITGVHAGGNASFVPVGPAADQSDEPDDVDASEPPDNDTSDRPAPKRQRMTEPPEVDEGELTANTQPEPLDPPTEELSLPSLQAAPLLKHDEPRLSGDQASALSAPTFQPAPTSWQPPVTSDETLTEIEQSVGSSHLPLGDSAQPSLTPSASDDEDKVDDARSAVEAALQNASTDSEPLQPIEALNAQPLGPELQSNPSAQPGTATPPPFAPPNLPSIDPSQPAFVANTGFKEPSPGNSPADQTLDMPLPTAAFSPPSGSTEQFQSPQAFPGAPTPSNDSNSGPTPPPVPPPMLPPLQ